MTPLAGTLALTPGAALWFLPVAAPVCLFVAFSDMARMRIPNVAVLALAGAFLLLGPLALPLDVWAWRLAQGAGVLLLGFLLSMAGALGAGDAKFAAAAAPYVAGADLGPLCVLFATTLLGAVAAHRLARAAPAVRRRVPHWRSWDHPKFPMGLALGGTLLFYLTLAATA